MQTNRILTVSSVLSSIFSFIIILMTIYHNHTVKEMLMELNEKKL
ncbi:hypothetical protein [Pueribacillus theae]|nr:hypothetical protein [Pueribacillus theae]